MEPKSEGRRPSLFQNLFQKRQSKSKSYAVNHDFELSTPEAGEFKSRVWESDNEEIEIKDRTAVPEKQKQKPGQRRGSVFERLRKKFETPNSQEENNNPSRSMMVEKANLEPSPPPPPPTKLEERRRSSLFTRLEQVMKMPPKPPANRKKSNESRRPFSGFRSRSRENALEELAETNQPIPPKSEVVIRKVDQAPSTTKRQSIFRGILNSVMHKSKHEPQNQGDHGAYYLQNAPSNGEAEMAPANGISERRSSSEYNVIELSKKYRQKEINQKKAMEKVQTINEEGQLQKMVIF